MAYVITGRPTDDMNAQCTLWMHESKSAVIVRRKFRSKYPRCRNNILLRKVIRTWTWYSRFTELGRIDKWNVHRGSSPFGPLIVEAIGNIYQENPSTSIRQIAQQAIIYMKSVHKVVRKKIKLYSYKIQIVQSLEDSIRSMTNLRELSCVSSMLTRHSHSPLDLLMWFGVM